MIFYFGALFIRFHGDQKQIAQTLMQQTISAFYIAITLLQSIKILRSN